MFGFVRQALNGLATDWRRQAAIRELSKLSDPLLADIGLRRDQLPTLALDFTSEKERARAPMQFRQQGMRRVAHIDAEDVRARLEQRPDPPGLGRSRPQRRHDQIGRAHV